MSSNFAVRASPPFAGRAARQPSWRHVHASATVLYVCVPSHNEAVTVGVLLWRLRTVLGEQVDRRDYEVVVYDDASTDATSDVLLPYARVLPLTVLRSDTRVGQTAAVEAVIRHVLGRTRAPERDALVLLQADYTDAPELLPELLAAFDAGADIVLTRRPTSADQPFGERRLRRLAALLAPIAHGAVRNATAAEPAALLSVARLFRVAVLRDAVRAAELAPLLSAPGWAGTAELVVRTTPFANQIARVDAPARYAVRTRASRVEWARELRAIAALLWQNRGAGRKRVASPPPVALPAGRPPQQDAPQSAARGALRDGLRDTHPAPRIRGKGTPRTSTPLRSVPLRPERLVDEPTLDKPTLDEPTPTADAPATRPGDLPPTTSADAVPAPDDAERRRRGPRRRRRGRGGAGDVVDPARDAQDDRGPSSPPLTLVGPTSGAAANTEAASAAREVDADDPTASAATSPADGAPGAPAKRRRRRGGARRGARGRERDGGVEPVDATDGDAATWQAAPSDQPSS